MTEVERRVGLVCGASKGIGRASALVLVEKGLEVFLLSRSADNLRAAAEAIEERTGQRPHTLVGRIGDPSLPGRVTTEIIDRAGRLDVLVNNSGGPPAGSFLDHSVAAWDEAFQQNLLSVVEFTKHAVPFMRQRGWGRIINITTTLSKEPVPNMVVSAALRAGVAAFTKAAARELASEGITVNNVCPSAVDTERSSELVRSIAETQGRSSEDVLAEATELLPIGRLASPRECAAVVGFLASEESSYVSGVSLVVDGASTRSTF